MEGNLKLRGDALKTFQDRDIQNKQFDQTTTNSYTQLGSLQLQEKP